MRDIRIIHNNNGTLSDLTINANNWHSGVDTIDIVSAEDYIYIGQRFPFNHIYLKFGTANTASSTLSIDLWDGQNWVDVVEAWDETSLSGAAFGQNGYISWVPDKQYGWGREDTVDSSGGNLITGFGTTVKIYDHYWIRLAFSADLDAGTTLSWCGPLFSNDDDLGSEYPDLVRSNTLDAWESGKTSWEEQHVAAARSIIRELKYSEVILHKGQILDRMDFRDASVSKVAEMAFNGMGPEFREDRTIAMSNFNSRMAKATPKIDKDLDANIDREEISSFQGRLTRGPTFGKQRDFS